MKYKICEDGIFKSIQGEGTNTGKASVFIRFADCNITPRCHFCDEEFTNYCLMDENEIMKTINSLEPFEMIVITGGEPTINDLSILINKLKNKNYYIAVETNGIINSGYNFDWVTCSPKNLEIKLEYANELKFVVDKSKESMQIFVETVCSKVKYDNLYLQPMSNQKKYLDIALNMIFENPQYRLSLQTHKIIGLK